MMKLKEALYLVREDEELGEMLKDMPFIGASTFTDMNENIKMWELNFYNPDKENVVRIIIDEDKVYEIYEGDFANPKDKDKFRDFRKQDVGIEIDEEKALDIAREEYFKKYDMKVERILIVYSAYENAWSINLFSSSSLKVIQIKIDAVTGDILLSREVDMVKRM